MECTAMWCNVMYVQIWYDMIFNIWYMIYEIWNMIYDIWYMKNDEWYMIYDFLPVYRVKNCIIHIYI